MVRFNDIACITLHTTRLKPMRRFYVEELGGRITSEDAVESNSAEGRPPARSSFARVEIAPDQFIELVAANEKPDGTSPMHITLALDNIFVARPQLEARSVCFDSPISRDSNGCYRMGTHDPDGNRIDLVQYTAESYRIATPTCD